MENRKKGNKTVHKISVKRLKRKKGVLVGS